MSPTPSKLLRGYKNNQKLLVLLEKMYLYGAFSKESLTSHLGIEPKTSEAYLLDLIYNFGDMHIKTFYRKNKKFYYASYNCIKDLYNYLVKVNYFKTTTQKRIQGYFFVLAILHKYPNINTKALLDHLSEHGQVYTDSFIRDLVSDMVDHGVVTRLSWGNQFLFCVTPDSLKGLTCQEVKSLYLAVDYFSNTLYPFAIGDLTRRNLSMYLLGHYGVSMPPDPCVHVLNRGLHLTLYEDLVLDMLKTIDNQSTLAVVNDKGDSLVFAPKQILVDHQINEIIVKGTLDSGEIGTLALFAMLQDKVPLFTAQVASQDSDQQMTPTLLTLNVAYTLQEYHLNRLRAAYYKAKLHIKNSSLTLDISAYGLAHQCDIILEELPLITNLSCPPPVRLKLNHICNKGVANHAN